MKANIYTEVTNSIIEAMKEGNFPSQQVWDKSKCSNKLANLVPSNAVTDNSYNGINRLILLVELFKKEYDKNLWCTFNQAKSKGWKVKKGSKSIKLTYFSKKTKADENGKDCDFFILKTFNVFNIEQIEGVDIDFNREPPVPLLKSGIIGEILKNTDVTIIANTGKEAFYMPSKDTIQIPHKEAFFSESLHTATLIHELFHATKAPHRLDRDYRRKYGDKEAYAREELVAELGSAFLCAEIGIIGETLQFHASYLDNWLSLLKDDPKAIFKASSDAQKASDFILKEWGGVELKEFQKVA